MSVILEQAVQASELHQANMLTALEDLHFPDGFPESEYGSIDVEAFERLSTDLFGFGLLDQEVPPGDAYDGSIWRWRTKACKRPERRRPEADMSEADVIDRGSSKSTSRSIRARCATSYADGGSVCCSCLPSPASGNSTRGGWRRATPRWRARSSPIFTTWRSPSWRTGRISGRLCEPRPRGLWWVWR